MSLVPGKIERMRASEVPNPEDYIVLLPVGPAFATPGSGGYNLWERVYSTARPGRTPGTIEFKGAHGGCVATHAPKDVISVVVLKS